MPFAHGAYLAVKNSRVLQIALLLAIAIKLWLINNFFVSRRATRKLRDRMRIKAIQKDQAIREHSNEAVQAADTVRANTERVSSARMHDESAPDYHFRD